MKKVKIAIITIIIILLYTIPTYAITPDVVYAMQIRTTKILPIAIIILLLIIFLLIKIRYKNKNKIKIIMNFLIVLSIIILIKFGYDYWQNEKIIIDYEKYLQHMEDILPDTVIPID